MGEGETKIQACRGPCASRQRFSPGGRCPGLLASAGCVPPLPVAQGLPRLAALMPIWKSNCCSSCCYEAGSLPDQEHSHIKGPGLCNLSQILESRFFKIFLKYVRGEQMMPSIWDQYSNYVGRARRTNFRGTETASGDGKAWKRSTRRATAFLVPVDGAHLVAGSTSSGNVVLSLLGLGWGGGEHSRGLVQ